MLGASSNLEPCLNMLICKHCINFIILRSYIALLVLFRVWIEHSFCILVELLSKIKESNALCILESILSKNWGGVLFGPLHSFTISCIISNILLHLLHPIIIFKILCRTSAQFRLRILILGDISWFKLHLATRAGVLGYSFLEGGWTTFGGGLVVFEGCHHLCWKLGMLRLN